MTRLRNFCIFLFMVTCCLHVLSCRTKTYNGKQVFRYNEPSGIASLDPAFAKNQSVMWPVNQLYNTLVETDSGLKIIPSLVKHWEISANRFEYTFHLRTDVFFHDNDAFTGKVGRRMVAADVVYSFMRLIDPATASPGAWIFNNRVDSVIPFTAINDSTFRLRLQRPFSPILGVLSNKYCSIVPREVVEKYGKDFRNHPCGTGPFIFKSWEEGQSLILWKNENYFEVVEKFGKDFRNHPCGTGPFIFKSWEEGQSLILWKNENYFEVDDQRKKLPYLDAIKVSFYDSRATEFLLFQQGQLDFINDIDPSFKDEVLNKKGELKKEWQGKIILNKHSYLNTEYLGILVDSSNDLVKQSPLRLQQIRQAINYGFDRKKLMLYLRNSIGIPAESGFVPAGLPSFNEKAVIGYRYDPEKARALLKSAGYDKGENLPSIKLLTIPIYSDLGSFIAKQLEEVGLNIQVEVIPKSLLLEQTAKSQALFFRGSWIADYPDAENYLSVFYGRNPAPPNYTRYNNPMFNRLYEVAMQEENDSVRYKLYQQMDRLIINDAPVVPLWYDEVIHLVNPEVKNFYPNSLNLLELRGVKVK